ncbi:MAG: NUDIX domain-containing protein [bacterium]
MKRKPVVTAFLQKNKKILICRRSEKVGTYRGEWAAISGHLEDNSPLAGVKREIKEETGLSGEDIQLLSEGDSIIIDDHDNNLYWRVYPFLFKIISDKKIKLNYENIEYRWIKPQQLEQFTTVPKLKEAWERVNIDRPE